MRPGNIACFNFLYYGKVCIAHILHGDGLRICFAFQRKGNWISKFIIIRGLILVKYMTRFQFFDPVRCASGCPAFYQTAIAIQKRKFRSEYSLRYRNLLLQDPVLYNHFLP